MLEDNETYFEMYESNAETVEQVKRRTRNRVAADLLAGLRLLPADSTVSVMLHVVSPIVECGGDI